MTYIAFIGYNESEFDNFKIGNKSVQICRKEDYPDPSDYILRQSQKLGVDGEKYIYDILTKINKDKMFKDFQIIESHNTPHSGDYLFIDKKNNICFMIECKNKNVISVKEDLNKFDTDIINVKETYKCNVIGVFLQIANNVITSHKSIELNEYTVYLTRDYINKSCLEIIFSNYMTINNNKDKITQNDCDFVKEIIQYLENINNSNDNNIKRIVKVISHNQRDITNLSKTLEDFNHQKEIIMKITDLYNQFITKNEDNDSLTDLKSLSSDDELFSSFKNNNDAKSCIVTKNNDKEQLFKLLKQKGKTPSKLRKRSLVKKYNQFIFYINSNTIDKIQKDYKQYLNQRI